MRNPFHVRSTSRTWPKWWLADLLEMAKKNATAVTENFEKNPMTRRDWQLFWMAVDQFGKCQVELERTTAAEAVARDGHRH